MSKSRFVLLVLSIFVSGLDVASGAEDGPEVRPATVRDIVRVRRIERSGGIFAGIAISPDGKWIAYVLREANFDKNVTEYALYVLPAPGFGSDTPPQSKTGQGRGRELLRTGGVGFQIPKVGFQWLADSRAILVLHTPFGGSRPIVSRVDLRTASSALVFSDDSFYVMNFSTNETGNRLAIFGFALDSQYLERFNSKRGVVITPEDYLLDDPRSPNLLYPERSYSHPELRVSESGTSVVIGRFEASNLNMSPDGTRLTFTASSQQVGVARPAAWQRDRENSQKATVSITLPERIAARHARSTPVLGGIQVPWPAELKLNALSQQTQNGMTQEKPAVRGEIAVNERVSVGVQESPSTPPNLYAVDLRTGRRTLLTDLNPEVSFQRLGKIERIDWTESPGNDYWGYIVYPVDYVPGRRYPAVLLSKDWDESFYAGAGKYRSSFPPQALASSDILVFMLSSAKASVDDEDGRGNMTTSDHSRKYYGARKQLDARGLIDPARVGIMGFSHSGTQVAWLISHPSQDPQWAAAVIADGGTFDYAQPMGSPVGRSGDGSGCCARMLFTKQFSKGRTVDESLMHLLERSAAWNAQRVRTPLLQQTHGMHRRYAAELYSALWVRGKPVELIWFPDGMHNLQSPAEQESSMEQAVDWFRFWLQGYERPAVPSDPDRYARWRKLREEHQRNEEWIAQGKNPSVEFYAQLKAEPAGN